MNKFILKTLAIVGPFLFLVTSNAHSASAAECHQRTRFNVEDHPQDLCWDKKLEGWLSPSCFEKKECGARKIAKTAESKKLTKKELNLEGGKNPGSVACGPLGGKLNYAILESGSQVTFCEAQDKSLIDTNIISNLLAE
jgi:hypothetical protein